MKPAFVIVLALVLSLTPVTLLAADVAVPGGSANAIQDAVRAAGPGGTVVLLSGTHRVTRSVLVDVPGVFIRGKGRAKIVCEREPEGDPVSVFLVTAPGVRISGLRLSGDRHSGSVGIEAHPPAGGRIDVAKNRIENFDAGIRADGEGVAVITGNRVTRCTNGLDLAYETTAVGWEISKNRVNDVLATGIFVGDADGSVIRRNDVRRAGTDGINLGGVFLTVKDNRTRLNAGYGLFGATNSCDYISNKAVRNGNGIRVQGTGNRLKQNRGKKNLGDGVVSTGGNVNAEGNRGARNGGTQVSIG